MTVDLLQIIIPSLISVITIIIQPIFNKYMPDFYEKRKVKFFLFFIKTTALLSTLAFFIIGYFEIKTNLSVVQATSKSFVEFQSTYIDEAKSALELNALVESLNNEMQSYKENLNDYEKQLNIADQSSIEIPTLKQDIENINEKMNEINELKEQVNQLSLDLNLYRQSSQITQTNSSLLEPENNIEINQAKVSESTEEIDSEKSVFLKDLVWFTGRDWEFNGSMTDNLGNTQLNCVTNRYELYNVYKIDGQYKIITGTLFRTFGLRDNERNIFIQIDGDGEVLYSGAVDKGIEPIDFSVDITGVNDLQVSFYYDTGHSRKGVQNIYGGISNLKLWK